MQAFSYREPEIFYCTFAILLDILFERVSIMLNSSKGEETHKSKNAN